MTSIRWTILFLFVAFLLVCFVFIWQSTTLVRAIPCEQMIDSRLKNVDFVTLQSSDEKRWIDNRFSFNRLEEHDHGERTVWTWHSLRKEYAMERKDEVIWLEQFWRFSTVHIEDALRCLGEPDAYLSFGERGPDAVLYTLSLLYEKQGYMVTAQYFYNTPEPPPVTKDTPLFYIGFLPPATAEQIIARRYDDTLAEAVRSWPGDIRQVEVPTIYVR